MSVMSKLHTTSPYASVQQTEAASGFSPSDNMRRKSMAVMSIPELSMLDASREETPSTRSTHAPEGSPLLKVMSRGHCCILMDLSLIIFSWNSSTRLNSASMDSLPPRTHLTSSRIQPLSPTVADFSLPIFHVCRFSTNPPSIFFLFISFPSY